MESFLYVAMCFALVAMGLAIGVIINHSQKSTFENYFSAVLAEMMETNRRVEGLTIELKSLESEVYTEALPLGEDVYEDDMTEITQELPSIDIDDDDEWDWR